jgi:hypothetical protein
MNVNELVGLKSNLLYLSNKYYKNNKNIVMPNNGLITILDT